MRTLRFAAVLILIAVSATAGVESRVGDDALAPLRTSVMIQHVRIDRLPLVGGAPATVDLEQFEVWNRDSKVVIHSAEGVQELAPPNTRFYRGKVRGYDDSMAVFSVGDTITGLLTIGERRFIVGARFRDASLRGPQRRLTESDVDYYLVRESTKEDQDLESAEQKPWICNIEKLPVRPGAYGVHSSADRPPARDAAISGTQSYAITLEIETDYELYQTLSSSTANVTQYLQNLVAALSTIYKRDINTTVTIANTHIYTVADGATGGSFITADPNSQGTDAVLTQLSNYYVANKASVKRSAVVYIGGREYGGGIAWLGTICGGDHTSGGQSWGAYAVCTGVLPDTPTRIPDPNNITNTGGYYFNPFSNDYQWVTWPLTVVAHELGHTMGSPHTHCMALSPADQTTYGRQYVDQCYNGETNCFGGTQTLPTELGTIMSYCHLLSAGMANVRLTFGLPTEASHYVQDRYLLSPTGPASGYGNIVTGMTLTLSAITAPSSVAPSSTGNAASISAITGATYAWTITNGTITGGQGTNAVTFTAGTSGTITLRASAYGTNGCGASDTKSVAISTATLNPPTNVVATASTSTSIGVSWTASTGAASYNVYRAALATTFTLIGSTATTSYTDNTAIANTAYLYKVRAVSGSESADSNKDVATAIIFTDPTITARSTTVRAVHIAELRTAVNAVRTLAGLTPMVFTDTTLAAGKTAIKAVHVSELRSAVTAARTAIGLSNAAFTDPTLSTSIAVKKVHIDDLRSRVK